MQEWSSTEESQSPGFQREGTRSNHCRAKMLWGGLSGCGWDDQGGFLERWNGGLLSQLEPKAARQVPRYSAECLGRLPAHNLDPIQIAAGNGNPETVSCQSSAPARKKDQTASNKGQQ